MRATPYKSWLVWAITALCIVGAVAPITADPAPTSPQGPPALSAEQVSLWLSAHRGVQRFSIDDHGTLKGESVIEVRGDGQHIDVYDVADVFSHGRHPSDEHRVSHKRFQAHSPYALLSAEWYELKQGEARVGAWRSTEAGQAQGEWRESPAQVLRRAERRGAYEGIRLAGSLWRSAQRGRSLKAPETLVAHIGAQVLSMGQRLEVSALSWGEVKRYTISLLDQRLARPHTLGSEWVELLEVKVTASSGQVSRQLRSTAGQLLSTSASDQIALIATPPLISERRSMSALSSARGSLSERQLQSAMSPARDAFSACSRQHNPERSTLTRLTLRLYLSAQGQLTAVGFDDAETWGPLERCIAHEVTRLRFPPPRGGEALIKYPLRFHPRR